MRDPFALAVWLLGTAVMAYGFWSVVAAGVDGVVALAWEMALLAGGLVAACVGGYAVGRSETSGPDRDAK